LGDLLAFFILGEKIKGRSPRIKSQKIMSYLDKTVAEMKYQILNTFQSLRNVSTDKQAAYHIEKLEKLIKQELIKSFKNGIEVGKKKQTDFKQEK